MGICQQTSVPLLESTSRRIGGHLIPFVKRTASHKATIAEPSPFMQRPGKNTDNCRRKKITRQRYNYELPLIELEECPARGTTPWVVLTIVESGSACRISGPAAFFRIRLRRCAKYPSYHGHISVGATRITISVRQDPVLLPALRSQNAAP